MSTPLPPFTEPDWSKLPPEAVAWAVDADGHAYTYASVPYQDLGGHEDWICAWAVLSAPDIFDLTNIDWRTTLRLRPTEPAKVEPEDKSPVKRLQDLASESALKSPELAAHIQRLAEGVEDCAESQRNYELERLAELAWVARITSGSWEPEGAACGAFNMAAAFIEEREKRRGK